MHGTEDLIADLPRVGGNPRSLFEPIGGTTYVAANGGNHRRYDLLGRWFACLGWR